MLTVFGEKPPLVMLTCFVVAPSAAGATASSATTTLMPSSKRICIADLLVAVDLVAATIPRRVSRAPKNDTLFTDRSVAFTGSAASVAALRLLNRASGGVAQTLQHR